MQQITMRSQYKKAPDLERFSICNSKMVRLMDCRWNHFEAELRLIHSKLERFGLAFINGEVVYLNDMEASDA